MATDDGGGSGGSGGGGAPSIFDLPSEVLQGIFAYLDARSLARAARVCRFFRENADAEHLWRDLCCARWSDKKFMTHEVFFRANLAHPAAIGALSVGELKLVLRKRHVPVDGVLREKSDLIDAMRRAHPDVAFPVPLPTKWKASYAAAELDSRRDVLTMEELTAYPWKLRFKQQPNLYMISRFTKNFVYESPEHIFDWRFYSSNFVQVAQFPPLQMKRMPEDWGWQLENAYVVFTMAPELSGVDFVPGSNMHQFARDDENEEVAEAAAEDDGGRAN